jgi:hypothetical protein
MLKNQNFIRDKPLIVIMEAPLKRRSTSTRLHSAKFPEGCNLQQQTNAYNAVQILLASRLLSKSAKIKTGYTKLTFYLLFCMGVKRGISHQGKNNYCLRTVCLREYLDLQRLKWRKNGENFLTGTFIACTLRHIQLE